jgi:trehalose 6-phosphate phosphatase
MTERLALDGRLSELAHTPVLLVACDYDGTLADIVVDPSTARPRPESVVALRTLAGLADTHVSVISGRSLRDLAALSRLPHEIHLVGSHGSEFDIGFAFDLPAEARDLQSHLAGELARLTDDLPGVRLELKPAAVAVHYREVDPARIEDLLATVARGPGAWPGIHLRNGKMVVELAVVPTSKGHALDVIRQRVGASAVLFIGDDVTDEDAFVTLTGPDVGVKVGDGATAASFRVGDTDTVSQLLARLAENRRQWLLGASAPPIERHMLLSDRRTTALIAPNARVTWFCHPRSDGSAIFAELLGGPTAGYFAVRPLQETTPIGQHYLPDTLVAETRWPGVSVVDYLDSDDEATQLVRVLSGFRPAVVEFAPRLDYSRAATRLRVWDDGLEVAGTSDPIVLRAPGLAWELVDEGPHQTARATVDLAAGPVVLELRCGTSSLHRHAVEEPERRRRIEDDWRTWAAGLTLPSVETELVLRSALTLRALCHEPTGAILAAATTSLPEVVGGIRNWDYRHCWIRDGSLSAAALCRLGSHREALAFLEWMLQILESTPGPERLRPVYTVAGHDLMSEAAITQLSGYAGSRPVRIGNAAEHQVQLDTFAPVVDLVALLAECGVPIAPDHWTIVEAMVQAVERRWFEPDHGIWEVRLQPRHHVHSKVMCWHTVDRALSLTRLLHSADRPDWVALRATIADDVLAHGWKTGANTFTAAYDGEDLDAAVLHIGLTGLLAPDDKRFLSTIHAIELLLRDGPTVYRYRTDDGLPGFEGGFHLCASWLVDAYLLAGRVDDALDLFRQLVTLAGPTGLLSEQYDPAEERALGNFPQAYSHLGIINNAVMIQKVAGGRV